jgi:hypothetical protein
VPEEREPISTAPRDHDRRLQRRSRDLHRAFFVGLALFVLAAALGVFGARGRSTTVAGGGYELAVHYPQVTRPGLSEPVWFVVRREEGGPLPGEITLETTADYLRIFDDLAIEPEPEQSRADGEDLVWVFSPEEDAEVLEVFLDVRVDPGIQWGREGTVTLHAEGEERASTDVRTWVLP